MLKTQDGKEVSVSQALDFIYKSTRNLTATADEHAQLQAAYMMIKKEIEQKEVQHIQAED